MRIAIGAITLLLGIIIFGTAAPNLPPGAGPQFVFGYFLPSGAIIVLGVVILAWNKKGKEE
ncbi:hypothetical protein LZ24_03464 [Desulfobotulus alkaliphilus]|uniref:Uncharacterized protein n=1 Tax=Desulfobotulus alkaliphilus TaxID=622671 RepID=A0A562QWF4_9BACT|nr:hypothetical protein [Desulfobotulus alkaliphilus]TWI61097.1 hypothetical protein LZ24_03464 [Desulfobotulus alkaliphilus]